MNTTGIFTTHYHVITVKETGKPIYLIPFGDVHRFSPHCSEDYWGRFIEWARHKPRAYFIGMGDYMDLASASERNILNDNTLHDSTIKTIQQLYLDNTKRFAKEISFMRGRLVGLIEGNHYATFSNGTTSTQKLCELLECKYLGVSAFVKLSFRYHNRNQGSGDVDLWAHHGKGAARLIGGSLNRVQQMAEQAEADIYMMAHDHKKSVGTKSILKLNASQGNVRLVHRKQIFARTGSFLRGYVENEASYIADANLNPTDLGVVKIEMTPRRPHQEQVHIDLHASI